MATHPAPLQLLEVLLREPLAVLLLVHALSAVALLELLAHDARLHRLHPLLAYDVVALFVFGWAARGVSLSRGWE